MRLDDIFFNWLEENSGKVLGILAVVLILSTLVFLDSEGANMTPPTNWIDGMQEQFMTDSEFKRALRGAK